MILKTVQKHSHTHTKHKVFQNARVQCIRPLNPILFIFLFCPFRSSLFYPLTIMKVAVVVRKKEGERNGTPTATTTTT